MLKEILLDDISKMIIETHEEDGFEYKLGRRYPESHHLDREEVIEND